MSYKLIESRLKAEGGITITYGIAGLAEEIEDVSLDRSEVCDLIIKFNTMELDPVHLHDAVEDYLQRSCNLE